MSLHRHAGLCGPDCPYRRLYEGSQASLSDMAGKQAGALNRVARLRSGIVAALKQNFAVEFGRAETQMSKRMSSVDDEVLLAYLDGFLALPTARVTAATAPAPAGLGDLRDELEALGVALPAGADLAAWAAAVGAWSQDRLAAAAAPAEPPTPSEPAEAAPGPARRRRTGGHGLLEGAVLTGFAEPGAGPEEHPADLSTPAAPGEDIPWGEEPAEDELEALGGFAEADAGGLEDLFGPDDLSSLFSEDLSDDAEELVEALFSADTPTSDPAPEPAPALKPRQRPATPPAEPEPAPAPEPGAFPSPPTTAGLPSPSAPAPAPAPAVTTRTTGSALRPELFPAAQLPKTGKGARRPARTARVSAARPDPRGLDVPILEGGSDAELTQEVFDKLVASVCIPRPVFIADLVAQTGSAELVDAWHQRCRDMGTASPVRFITPKPRHRDRGALIVPHSDDLRKAASEFTRSWWATCLDERRLRGAMLYEVAVLLHRFGESIISSRIEGDVVVLRVNQARGLVGVAMALGSDLSPGGTTRVQLADAVGELLTDRLTLVAVLTYASGGGMLEKLAGAVREEGQGRGWSTTTPVIASTSWDFAADGGASALAVL